MASRIPDEVMIDAALIKELAEVAKDAALLQGVLMRTKESPNSSELVTYAPFTLFPSPVPKSVFLQALSVQTHFNTLVDKISQDIDFLQEALASTIEVDDFTARLFKIHQQILKEGRSQVRISQTCMKESKQHSSYVVEEGITYLILHNTAPSNTKEKTQTK
uniref:Uncharacterized protein n=1 Tax=Poecilia mexicana TaxID=48701 RepID=A0A3B3YGJ4_9TELE